MSEPEVITVERYDPARNETIDLTEAAGINQPRGSYTDIGAMVSYGASIVKQIEADEVPEYALYDRISIEWGKLGFNKRKSEVEKTMVWGDYEVHFVTWWTISYQVAQPIDIRVT